MGETGRWDDLGLVEAEGICHLAHPGARGRGLVTRTFRHMIDWAFQERGKFQVELRASPTNARSCRIASRLGMTREGLLRGAVVIGGVRYDSEVWSVLAHEWPSLRSHPDLTKPA